MARNPIGAEGAKAWPALQSSSKHFACSEGTIRLFQIARDHCAWMILDVFGFSVLQKCFRWVPAVGLQKKGWAQLQPARK